MKIALLQFNPTVGALESNAAAIVDMARKAHAEGADVAVTSELALPGYPPRDLLDAQGFQERAAAATRYVIEQSPPELTLVFGTLGRAERGHAAGLCTNAAIVAASGQEVARATKQLLPTYDVFDESRYFEAGTETLVTDIAGRRVAVTVCEDAWATQPAVAARYRHNPLDAVREQGAQLILNVSASPFTLDKLQDRPRMFSEIAASHGVPLVFVNQVGANDELVFDGRSAVWDGQGGLIARAKMFEDDLLVCNLNDGTGRLEPEPTSREAAAYHALVLGIRDYTHKCGFRKVVIGLSGGIDSALTAVLAVDALGAENVLGVAMPTRYSSPGSLDDAAALARNLGIAYHVMNIDPIFEGYLQQLGPFLDEVQTPLPGDVTLENVQARIRGATLMALSNRTGALVLTTGNKSEIAVGYCTLYGDMVGGLAAISDVPKTMVYAISRWVNRDRERIPQSSITKEPSAELRPDQKDEDSLPPYEDLDQVLELYVEEHLSSRQIIERGFAPELVQRVLHLVRGSEYKRRQAAPGIIVTRKAFGSGRRVPVAQGYRDEP